MTSAALTKLAVLVILAFIICLPEFFTLNKESVVSLRCVRHQLCGHEENDEGEDVWTEKTCHEQWEHCSAQANQSNVTEAGISCFVCEADVNMAGFDRNSSTPAQNVYFEVWLNLQFTNTESVNFTLFGRYNHSSMQLTDEQEDEEDERRDDEGPNKVFLYCPPLLDTSNHSHCLLWLSNQIFATARGRLPWKQTTKDDWRCVFRVVWLTLLCVVLLLIVITVLGQIIKGKKRRSDKAKMHPFNYTIQGQHVINKERYCELNTPKVLNLETEVPRLWPVLSTIEEVDTPDETKTEMFFNENMDNGCNGRPKCHKDTNAIHKEPPTCNIAVSPHPPLEQQTW